MDSSGEGTPYQHTGDEGTSTFFKCLTTQYHGRDLSSDDDNATVVAEKTRQHSVSGCVQAGPEGHCLVGAAHGQHHGKIHSEESHSYRPVKPSRSGPSPEMVSPSLRVRQHMWGVQSLSHRPVCYQGEHEALYVLPIPDPITWQEDAFHHQWDD